MNYELLKHRMEKFFKETSPEQLVSQFEEMGYEFIDTKSLEWVPFDCSYKLELNECKTAKRYRPKWLSKKETAKKLTSNFSGSFFCGKIAV